jgi:Saccharopine dehydrogenase NADP binding domain
MTFHISTTRTVPSSMVSPMHTDKKSVRSLPFPVFLITAAILPVWAVTFLPITILYQLSRKMLLPSPNSKEETLPQIDSGYVVDRSKVIPRIERRYDIVVLGATGFVGKLAARHLAKTYGAGKKSVSWAVAGRNETKLRKVLSELAIELKLPQLNTDIDIIVVDTAVPCTMPKLVENTRCVATTAGPYTFYGNSVVEFCVKFGTHYVDITGEVDWVRMMIDKWSPLAKQTGSTLIPFCGHE